MAFYRHPEITHTGCCSAMTTRPSGAQEKYPNEIVGFGYVSAKTEATPAKIREFLDRGLRGVKVIGMRRPLATDISLFPMYEAIQEAHLPTLFHTGFLGMGEEPDLRERPESMLFMRPGTLRHHLPVVPESGGRRRGTLASRSAKRPSWVAWKFEHAYFDLSGGSVRRKSMRQLKDLFMWGAGGGFLKGRRGRGASCGRRERLVFGSDNRAPAGVPGFLQAA